MQTHTKTWLSTSAAATLLLLAARPIDAHHSAAIFDTGHTINISGTIVRFESVNPHSQIYIEIGSADGPVEWSIEGPAPNQLGRRGFDIASLAPGGRLEACGYVFKDPQTPEAEHHLLAEVIAFADGTALLWSPYGNRLCRDEHEYDLS